MKKVLAICTVACAGGLNHVTMFSHWLFQQSSAYCEEAEGHGMFPDSFVRVRERWLGMRQLERETAPGPSE